MPRRVNSEKGKQGFQPSTRGATPPSAQSEPTEVAPRDNDQPIDYNTLYTRFEEKAPLTVGADLAAGMDFDARVRALEDEGIPTSDAQAIVEAEDWVQNHSLSGDEPAEQAMNETLAYLNSHDPERREQHGNPSRTDLWRYAHMECAELAPHMSLQARDEAAELIAAACAKDVRITKPGGAFTILDNDKYLRAANDWDLIQMNTRLQELVHTHATDKENDIYDATVEKVAAKLNVDTDDAADVVWNTAREANMCHWQYNEADLLEGKAKDGLLSRSGEKIATADAVQALRRCHRGDHLEIETRDELNAVTSLLSDKGLRHGFPLKVKLAKQASTEIDDHVNGMFPDEREHLRDLLKSSQIR